MQLFIYYFILGIPLLSHSIMGMRSKYVYRAPLFESYNILHPSKEVESDTLTTNRENSNFNNNAPEHYRSELNSSDTSELFANENSSQTDQLNSTFTVNISSQSPVFTTDNVPNTLSTHEEATLTEIFSSESNSPSSVKYSSNSSSRTTLGGESTSSVALTTKGTDGSSTTEDVEPEGVARGKPTSTENITSATTSQPKTLYQKALEVMNDTYILSILIPVAAGIVFASTIIVTIATCRCLKRRCRRRRLRRKTLPESVKNWRPSDRARLLAESTDEEF